MKVLVTGANGFIGVPLCTRLLAEGWSVYGVVRSTAAIERLPHGVEPVVVGSFSTDTSWQESLTGIDTIIHLAARVHVMNDGVADPLEEYRLVNVEGTLNLARQAVSAGVRRFIFISSIKVNGEATTSQPFSAADSPSPVDPYGISKLEAERGLQQLAKETALDVVIIRPPLVYGPGVKGNFQSMIHWVGKGVPLPLGAIHNQRSLVGLDNLIDFIVTCIDHPDVANQTFLVSDGEDLSTTELLQHLARAMGKSARLIPVPVQMLELAAGLFGKQAIIQRLCGNLQIDISKAREVLDWEPPVSVDEGLRRTVHNLNVNADERRKTG